MKKPERMTKRKRISLRLLGSYLVIILAPAVAIGVIYAVMQGALLDIQKEKAQNLSMETSVAFCKEVEQLSNIARYIATDDDLKAYVSEEESRNSAQEYYRAYELAKSFPDYAVLNSLISQIYIMPRQTSYLIQVPRVVPNNTLGMSVLDLNEGENGYHELVESLYELPRDGMIYGEYSGLPRACRIIQHFDYTGRGDRAGVVMIELDGREIRNMLAKSLWTETGMAFLVDDAGGILYVYDSYADWYTASPSQDTWQEYLEEHSWEYGRTTVNRVPVGINNWSLVTVMPRQELYKRIGSGNYIVLAFCMVSILIGTGICLWYWNQNQTVVDRYLSFMEQYPDHGLAETESTDMWKNFGGVLKHAEYLHTALDRQRDRQREEIVRKLLYGIYGSGEELDQELTESGLKLPVEFPCILAGLQLKDPATGETEVAAKEFEETLTECLAQQLPYPYYLIGMGAVDYVLLIGIGPGAVDSQKIRQLFETIDYEVSSRMPVSIHIGISSAADTALALAGEYEHICRACEYAWYYKLRVPCLIDELPGHPHAALTVELEIQLEKTIQNGTQEQLEAVVNRVRENYVLLPGEGMPSRYNLEVLRCILLRCLENGEKEPGRESLYAQVHAARTPGEMEESIFLVWEYYAKRRLLCQDLDVERVKVEAKAHIEECYPVAEYNLAMLAEQLGVQEKKLYRDFKKMFGVSFSSYLEMKRISCAQKFLKEGRPVTEVAQAVGYSSDYSFRRAFKRVVGVAPSDYQKMQEGHTQA